MRAAARDCGARGTSALVLSTLGRRRRPQGHERRSSPSPRTARALGKGAVFQPGDMVFFSFQVENYRMGLTGKVQLTGHIQAFDPNGTPIMPRDEELIGTTVSEEDKDWKPKLRLADSDAFHRAAGELHDPVRSHRPAEPSDRDRRSGLSGRRQRRGTLAGAGDPQSGLLSFPGRSRPPLKIAAYRPGDMLWVRFDITGYQYGDQNSIDAGYDVEVLSPERQAVVRGGECGGREKPGLLSATVGAGHVQPEPAIEYDPGRPTRW